MTPTPRQALLLDEVRARGSVSVEALAGERSWVSSKRCGSPEGRGGVKQSPRGCNETNIDQRTGWFV